MLAIIYVRTYVSYKEKYFMIQACKSGYLTRPVCMSTGLLRLPLCQPVCLV